MQIRAHCNFTKPCLQWDGVSCIKLAVCSAMECKEDLSVYRLSIEDTHRNNYIHGDMISIGCDDGYEFETGVNVIHIHCLMGKWHAFFNDKIPKCSRYSDCIIRPSKGMEFFLAHEHPDGSVTIKHNEIGMYVSH